MTKRKSPARDEAQPPESVPVVSPQRRPEVSEHRPPALPDLVRAIRVAVGAVLDLADRAADVISKRIESRA